MSPAQTRTSGMTRSVRMPSPPAATGAPPSGRLNISWLFVPAGAFEDAAGAPVPGSSAFFPKS